MLTTLIWWSGILVDALILVRGMQTGLLRKYALFYFYIACMFSVEALRFCSYRFAPQLYPTVYWNSETVIILASYAVVAAIYKRALADYPGIARLGRNFLCLVLVAALLSTVSFYVRGRFETWNAATAVLGKDLRYIEGFLLLALIWLLRHYHIAMGQNLRGLTLGYGFFLATDILSRGILFLLPNNPFSVFLRRVLPVTYLITLIIWCVMLWASLPDPVRELDSEINRDYEALVGKTHAILKRVREMFMRFFRP
jgi:hypothetical protein